MNLSTLLDGHRRQNYRMPFVAKVPMLNELTDSDTKAGEIVKIYQQRQKK